VLYSPVSNEAWAGAVGQGSVVVSADGRRAPLSVSTVAKLAESRIVSSRSHRSAALEAALAALGARSLAALGSAGLKCAEIARGKAEAYVAPARAGARWDLCAGQAIITAAGGRVTDAYGNAIDYRSESLINESGIVASNGRVHDEILARLSAHRES
jgi:3'(2'), 5'-bisphosphate nucleotidase